MLLVTLGNWGDILGLQGNICDFHYTDDMSIDVRKIAVGLTLNI